MSSAFSNALASIGQWWRIPTDELFEHVYKRNIFGQIFNDSFDVLAVMALAEAVSTTDTALDKNYAIIEDCNAPERALRFFYDCCYFDFK